MQGTAIFSTCGQYRYLLTRTWDERLPCAVVIGCNPSTADAMQLDPTVRRCVDFAQRFGCGKLHMLNLFGLRSPYPKVVKAHADPVGPLNDVTIVEACENARFVLAAWGAIADIQGRLEQAATLLSDVKLQCLGLTAQGQPRHPLYIKKSAELIPYSFA